MEVMGNRDKYGVWKGIKAMICVVCQMSEERYKYINTTYQRVSAKMYDYNCDIKLKVLLPIVLRPITVL